MVVSTNVSQKSDFDIFSITIFSRLDVVDLEKISKNWREKNTLFKRAKRVIFLIEIWVEKDIRCKQSL